jgi:phosphoglycolate phosphatase
MPQSYIPAYIQAIIFDKDGTLIDFDAMWGGWITELARHLEAAANIEIAPQLSQLVDYASAASGIAPPKPLAIATKTGETATNIMIAPQLFRAVGFDPATGEVAPTGPLAVATMTEIRALAGEVLRAAGLTSASAAAVIQAGWHIPDPVALAQPLADLPVLFGAVRARGIRIAVATTDDRTPTLATLDALGVAPLVDRLACGDDGRPIKPAPDAILALCHDLGIAPAQAAMVGDTTADLHMGRAAGVGLNIGVLSGVGSAELLAPLADVLLPSVADLWG